MLQSPLHLKYELTRKDRLFSHLKEEGVWGIFGTIASLIIFMILISATIFHARRGAFADAGIFFCFLLIWLFTSFFILDFKLWEVLLVSRKKIDVIVTDQAFEILGIDDRWMIWLDGVTSIKAFIPKISTIRHVNGFELLIPAGLMSVELLEHLEERRCWGKTRAGIEAVIQRGRLIQSVLDSSNEPSASTPQLPENAERAPEGQGENCQCADDPSGDEEGLEAG